MSKRVLQQKAMVFVLFSDHRRLLMKAYTIIGVVCFFNAHALDNHTYTHAQVAQWWEDTDKLLAHHVDPRFPCVWLIDANATRGDQVSPAVGNRHAAKQSPARAHFHALLLKMALRLPSTFSTDPNGPGTWVDTYGNEKRIDYVAVPQEWLCYVSSARVDRNVVLAIDDKVDRRLLRVDLHLPGDSECKTDSPATTAWTPSKDLLTLPCYRKAIEARWTDVRPTLPHWTIDFHADMLANLLRTSWSETCPAVTRASNMPLVTPELWATILDHASKQKTFFAKTSKEDPSATARLQDELKTRALQAKRAINTKVLLNGQINKTKNP